MEKWKTVRVRQELIEEVEKEVEKSQFKSLSEFVSESIQHRLQTLAKERVSEYLKRDRYTRTPQLQAQLFYTPKHIWTQITPQGNVKIGITSYFQAQLKEIVNVTTDEIGKKVSKDEPLGMVETWWSTYDLYSPINGKIVSLNKAVMDDPFTLNEDLHQWIVEIRPDSTEIDEELKGLLGSKEYEKLTS